MLIHIKGQLTFGELKLARISYRRACGRAVAPHAFKFQEHVWGEALLSGVLLI